MAELRRWFVIESGCAVWIIRVIIGVFVQVAGEHSLFARFTVVELLNQLSVPICEEAMTAVNLQLVGLIDVIFLKKVASCGVILDIRLRPLDYANLWRQFLL